MRDNNILISHSLIKLFCYSGIHHTIRYINNTCLFCGHITRLISIGNQAVGNTAITGRLFAAGDTDPSGSFPVVSSYNPGLQCCSGQLSVRPGIVGAGCTRRSARFPVDHLIIGLFPFFICGFFMAMRLAFLRDRPLHCQIPASHPRTARRDAARGPNRCRSTWNQPGNICRNPSKSAPGVRGVSGTF